MFDFQKMLEKAPGEARNRLLHAEMFLRHGVAGHYLPPAPTPEVAAWIVLGKRPRDLAPGLTTKEAVEWVRQTRHSNPSAWFWAQCQSRHEELSGVGEPETITVARWVDSWMSCPAKKASALASRDGAFGDNVCGSVLDRLDEIQDCDLCKSPWGAVDNASARAAKNMWDGPDELIKRELWMDKLPDGCEIIRTFSRLYKEGSEMRHCVASYGRDIASGSCLIFSIYVDGKRSTAEYRHGKLGQHKGPRNTVPDEACLKRSKILQDYLHANL